MSDSIEVNKVEDKVNVFYNGEKFEVPADATEESVRDGMVDAGYPEVANARITKDDESGNWTITREAGQKGS